MSTKVCDSFDEAIEYLTAIKKKNEEANLSFNGLINIEIKEEVKREDYNEGLEAYSENALSRFITDNSSMCDPISEKVFPDESCDKYEKYADSNKYAKHLFDDFIEEMLYNNSETELYNTSIYGMTDSLCYMKVFGDDARSTIERNKALVHCYMHKFVCIEVSPKVYYFKGDKTFTRIHKVLDAEQVILKILQRMYDIEYNLKNYGY